MTQIAVPKQGSKIGMSSNIGTSYGYLQNAAVSEPGGVQAMVKSDSANDTAAGTGMQQVRIRYFDTSWILNDEIVILNGTSGVTTVATDIQRIESFEAYQTGINATALGTVTLTSTDGTKKYAQIEPITTSFTSAIHTISPGHVGQMIDVSVSCTTSSGITFVIFKEVDNTPNGGIVSIPDMIFTALDSNTTVTLGVPLQCDAVQSTVGLRMGVAVKGGAASQAGSASFHYIES